jgi:hypothetical protein
MSSKTMRRSPAFPPVLTGYKLREIERTAFEQAEMILYAALDPAIAGKARKGDFVRCLDHFKLLQSPIN